MTARLQQIWFIGVATALLLCVSSVATAAPETDPLIDSPMALDPVIPIQKAVEKLPDGIVDMWLAAMDRPDVETRRRAIRSIGKAIEQGLAEMPSAVSVRLQALVKDAKAHRALRLAAAWTLIQADDRSASSALCEANRHADQDMVLLTDPMLVSWNNLDARSIWTERLENDNTPWTIRRSAIESLGKVGEAKVTDVLRRLATDLRRPTALRLVAARALGQVRSSGLVGDVNGMISGGSTSLTDKLVSVAMLASHQDQPTRAALLQLAGDEESAVVAAAIKVLLSFDAASLKPGLVRYANSPDANVRMLATRAMVKLRGTDMAAMLGDRLGDRNPAIRKFARDRLLEFASDDTLKKSVIDASVRALALDDWRSQEQAAFVVGKLDHEPGSDRLLQIMRDSPRHEPRMAAIAALRWLDVDSTLTPMLAHLKKLASRDIQDFDERRQLGLEQSQIIETLGLREYREAESHLMIYIPKTAPFFSSARAAAVWSLGHINAGNDDPSLSRQLIGRLSDVNPMEPEAQDVRQQSAIALGRMKVKGAVGALRKFNNMELEGADIVYPCRWALMQITGEPIESLPEREGLASNWFLEPMRKRN